MLHTINHKFRCILSTRSEINKLRRELAQLANCYFWQVHLKNFQQFKQGHRYLYFTASNAFGKVASDSSTKIQLERESSSTGIAYSLGLPSVQVITPYKELPNGYGVLVVERLTNRFGSLIREYRDTSHISQESSQNYATLAAKAIFQSNFRVLDSFSPTSELLREEEATWAVRNPDSLLQTIESIIELFRNPTIQNSLSQAFVGIDFEKMRNYLYALPSQINELTAIWGYSPSEYFAHNDTTVKNIYFGEGNKDQAAFLIDFEMAAATHYPILSLLRDITQFYSFSSYNSLLQQCFLKEAMELKLEHIPVLDEQQSNLLLRTAVLLGTLHLSHFLIRRSWDAHQDNGKTLSEIIAQDSEYELISNLFFNCIDNISFLDGLLEKEVEPETLTLVREPVRVGV